MPLPDAWSGVTTPNVMDRSFRSQVEASGSRPHVFAAVIHSERTAHGGEHLRRNLYREVLQQLKMSSGGDPLAAVK